MARDLGRSLEELGQMSHGELVAWRAFYVWEAAMADFRARGGKL